MVPALSPWVLLSPNGLAGPSLLPAPQSSVGIPAGSRVICSERDPLGAGTWHAGAATLEPPCRRVSGLLSWLCGDPRRIPTVALGIHPGRDHRLPRLSQRVTALGATSQEDAGCSRLCGAPGGDPCWIPAPTWWDPPGIYPRGTHRVAGRVLPQPRLEAPRRLPWAAEPSPPKSGRSQRDPVLRGIPC